MLAVIRLPLARRPIVFAEFLAHPEGCATLRIVSQMITTRYHMAMTGQGFRESRRYPKDTYAESYITKYTLVYEKDTALFGTGSSGQQKLTGNLAS